GRYTFIQLQRWRIQVSGKILTMKGVYSNGIDESLNKLTIGVKNNAVKERVIKKLVQLNIPKDAIKIFKMSPPKLLTSLRDQVSSFSGGIKITIGSGGSCTMGPTVRWR